MRALRPLGPVGKVAEAFFRAVSALERCLVANAVRRVLDLVSDSKLNTVLIAMSIAL